MKWIAGLLLYNIVSARLSFFNVKTNKEQDEMMNDVISDVLNNFKLDISVDDTTTNINSLFDNFGDNNNDNFFIDNSPSSMFSSFPSFQSFFDNDNNDGFTESQFVPKKPCNKHHKGKPMYLMMDMSNHMNPPKRVHTSSVFILEERNKVNGNTWRFTVKSNDGKEEITTSSWKEPKMYLCNSASCKKNVEMVNLFDGSNNAFGSRYMHLAPVTTLAPKHPADYIDDEDVLVADTGNNDENDNLILYGMTGIMICIILCGVLYAAWRYLLDKKGVNDMNNYVAMNEADNFQ